MIRVSTLSNQNAQSLANDVNSYIYQVYHKRKIISINYVFNSIIDYNKYNFILVL